MLLVFCHELVVEKGGVQLLVNYVQECWHVVYSFVQELQDKSDHFYFSRLELFIVHVYFFTFRIETLYS